jgi:hypothetical protein
MAMGLTYKLEREEGTPADRSTFKTAVPNARPGDTIPARPGQDASCDRRPEGWSARMIPS